MNIIFISCRDFQDDLPKAYFIRDQFHPHLASPIEREISDHSTSANENEVFAGYCYNSSTGTFNGNWYAYCDGSLYQITIEDTQNPAATRTALKFKKAQVSETGLLHWLETSFTNEKIIRQFKHLRRETPPLALSEQLRIKNDYYRPWAKGRWESIKTMLTQEMLKQPKLFPEKLISYQLDALGPLWNNLINFSSTEAAYQKALKAIITGEGLVDILSSSEPKEAKCAVLDLRKEGANFSFKMGYLPQFCSDQTTHAHVLESIRTVMALDGGHNLSDLPPFPEAYNTTLRSNIPSFTRSTMLAMACNMISNRQVDSEITSIFMIVLTLIQTETFRNACFLNPSHCHLYFNPGLLSQLQLELRMADPHDGAAASPLTKALMLAWQRIDLNTETCSEEQHAEWIQGARQIDQIMTEHLPIYLNIQDKIDQHYFNQLTLSELLYAFETRSMAQIDSWLQMPEFGQGLIQNVSKIEELLFLLSSLSPEKLQVLLSRKNVQDFLTQLLLPEGQLEKLLKGLPEDRISFLFAEPNFWQNYFSYISNAIQLEKILNLIFSQKIQKEKIAFLECLVDRLDLVFEMFRSLQQIQEFLSKFAPQQQAFFLLSPGFLKEMNPYIETYEQLQILLNPIPHQQREIFATKPWMVEKIEQLIHTVSEVSLLLYCFPETARGKLFKTPTMMHKIAGMIQTLFDLRTVYELLPESEKKLLLSLPQFKGQFFNMMRSLYDFKYFIDFTSEQERNDYAADAQTRAILSSFIAIKVKSLDDFKTVWGFPQELRIAVFSSPEVMEKIEHLKITTTHLIMLLQGAKDHEKLSVIDLFHVCIQKNRTILASLKASTAQFPDQEEILRLLSVAPASLVSSVFRTECSSNACFPALDPS